MDWSGKPDFVWLGVCEAVRERERVSDGVPVLVAEPLRVWDCVRDCVCDKVNDGLCDLDSDWLGV